VSVPGLHFFKNLVRRRTLLFQLVRRDFEQRFVGSAAGWLWTVIHPLVMLVSWVFVFQGCFKFSLPHGAVTQNYPLYLFCGDLPWLLFQDTVQRSASSILDQSNLITKTVFPSEVLPVSIFLSCLLSHLMTLVLAMAAAAWWESRVSFMVVLLPVYMLLIGLFAVGLGWVAASLQVYLRDTAHILTVILTFWFWMTPIFISRDQFPARFRFLLKINPLAYLVEAYRDRILSYRPPSLGEFAVVGAYAVTAFIVGGLFFRHLKRGFADVL